VPANASIANAVGMQKRLTPPVFPIIALPVFAPTSIVLDLSVSMLDTSMV